MGKQILKTLQIGMSWFPDRPGGLNRYYYDCANYFPGADIRFDGLVAGVNNAELDSGAKVVKFCANKRFCIKTLAGG